MEFHGPEVLLMVVEIMGWEPQARRGRVLGHSLFEEAGTSHDGQ
jgi:hypothetical protein